MFDARLRPLIDPPLNAAGRWLARYGIGANTITATGIVLGLGAGAAIAQSHYAIGIVLILANRLLDGLDGAVARATRLTDFGGYLDIVGDFVFYVAVPLGFGLASDTNQIPALVLTASFALTGASFLAFAAVAAKRGLQTVAHGRKSFFYSTGVAEGGETIVAFLLMAALPLWFPMIAWTYAILCIVTVVQRSILACSEFNIRLNE